MTGSGAEAPLPPLDGERAGAAEVQTPESARLPSVPKSTVAGSGSPAPRGGGAWVSILAAASAVAAAALLVFLLLSLIFFL